MIAYIRQLALWRFEFS